VARCVTCGVELHPERAERYDYCVDPDCQAKNARGLTIASVGVNKAADQFVVLDGRTEEEMASGRYLDSRRNSSASPARPRRERAQKPAPTGEPRLRSQQPDEQWTESQQNLALALHVTGRKSLHEIAARIGLRPDTVARMIVTAKRRWSR
jgi:hypothetical protein